MEKKIITIHCSATPNLRHYDISRIDAYHRSLGWSGCGYHMVIQPSGEVQMGRPLNRTGAHVSGANKNNIGICLIGTDKFTLPQLASLQYQLDGLFQTYSIRTKDVYCHHEFDSAKRQGKTCPNIRAVDLALWYHCCDESAIKEYIA